MARVVGTALVLLVLVAMPLKYFVGQHLGVEILGPLHGFLYMGYLVTVIDLVRRMNVRPWWVVAMVAAGLVPFLTFVLERRMVEKLAGADMQSVDNGKGGPLPQAETSSLRKEGQ